MSWTTLPVTEAQVRAYLDVDGTTGKYQDPLIASNIRAAASYLERETSRQFEAQTGVTKYFTSEGRAALRIPDLRTVTSATLQGVALDADDTYWLIGQGGIYTTVQFRAFGTGGYATYKSNPEWFDRDLDHPLMRYGGSLPNDLAITGDWGHVPYPHDFLHAVKVLAAWHTRRPASMMGNAAFTPDGNVINYGSLPPEVAAFIGSWKIGVQLVAV